MADAVAAAEPAGRKLTLESSDHEVYEVEESVAMASRTIRHMVEENWASDIIPLPNVHSSILAKVIVYCKEHAHKGGADATDATADAPAKASGTSLKAFDDKFLDVHQNVLFDLLLAANYLNIKALLDLTCQKVADMMKGKTLEQIRETFNIKNDLTKEEEEEIRKENQWAFV